MGLTHPRDLDAWSRWQASQRPLRRIAAAIRRTGPSGLYFQPPKDPQAPWVLVALDSNSPTSRASLIASCHHLPDPQVVGVLSVCPIPEFPDLTPVGSAPDLPSAPAAVMALGGYLPAGRAAVALAALHDVPFVVVQHGLLTPHAPPLPAACILLAWSAADGEFWRSGRADVDVTVVGSQLLWDAARRPNGAGRGPAGESTQSTTRDAAPVFLGQLHGAELPFSASATSAQRFCLEHSAIYRPHPSEQDRRSRRMHAKWEALGVTVDRKGQPLNALNAPVVSAFSTGVLEAAVRGLPAWVHFEQPPRWLEEFWARNGMSRWGGDPTPTPSLPTVSPAVTVANVLQEMMGR